jgi:hypothetical protein
MKPAKILAVSCAIHAATVLGDMLQTRLDGAFDKLVEQEMAAFKVPGLSLALITKDGVESKVSCPKIKAVALKTDLIELGLWVLSITRCQGNA